jgi:hypothetical protein
MTRQLHGTGQGLLMSSHCRNALSDLCEYFLKESFIPLHILRTHSSHVVLLHSNLFFASTYVFNVDINSMCGTREAQDMTIFDSEQRESPLSGPVHHHGKDVDGSQIFDYLAQQITNEFHCFVFT